MNNNLEKYKELPIHSSAIQITNNISLLQRKTWIYLLYKAYYLLPLQSRYKVRLNELMKELGFESKNENYLKESLKGLMSIVVEWNIFKKDKKYRWEASSLLASVVIDKGVCEYQISDLLREKLYNPEIYTKVILAIQNKFKSKNSHTLYLLLLDYSSLESVVFTLSDLKKCLGLNAEYKRNNDFINYVVKKSVNEINIVSNIKIKFETIKENKKIRSIKFYIYSNKENMPPLINKQKEENYIEISNNQLGIDLVKIIENTKEQNKSKVEIKIISKLTLKNEILRKFISDNNISIKVLKNTLSIISEKDNIHEDYQEDYLLFIKNYCENQKDVKNIAGLFINILKTGEQSENYLYKKSQELQEKLDKEEKFEKKYKEKILPYYEQLERNNIKTYLKENPNLFYELLEKYKENFAIIFALKKNNMKKDFELLNNVAVMGIFSHDVALQNDYSFISFEKWKYEWENNQENKDLILKLKKEAGYKL